ncbi:MAG: SCO family protein, partial [Flavobacteriales bacterium]|nr:SCO family protein [Flavobacteriales bacterium]
MIKKTPLLRSLVMVLLFVSFSASAQTKKDACCAKDSKNKHSKHAKAAKKDACCSPKTGDNSKVLKMGDMQIPTVELVNQDGEKVDLYKLVKGKVVAMNFVFTTCTTICPPMGVNFVKLMELMGDHVDKDLVMISVSIDPATDTPERLKSWSEKFKPGPGWNLLTGDKQTVDKLLKQLNIFTPLIEDHAPIILMGKEGEDNWIRTNGLGKPDQLAANLNKYFESEKVELVENKVQF